MRRGAIVAFALLASLLVVAAPPASASSHNTNTAVGSINTTDTDFQNADTLTNAFIIGSGNDAYIDASISGSATLDDLEDGNINEYGGDTGQYQVQSTTVQVGQDALEDTSASGGDSIADTGVTVAQGDTFTAWIRSADATYYPEFIFGAQSETALPDGYYVELRTGNNVLAIEERNGGSTSTLNTTAATVSADTWYQPEIQWESGGHIRVDLLDAAGNSVAVVEADDASFSSGGIGFYTNGLQAFYDDVNVSGSTTSTYIANHTIDDPTNAFTNITLSNAEATVTWQECSSGTCSDIRTDTYTTGGNKTVDISSASSSTIRVNVTFQKTGSNPAAELGDEGVLFENHAPVIENATATPSGGTSQNDEDVTLSIDIGDETFSKAQGDTATVTFRMNNTIVDTQTTSSNGTVSTTVQDVTNGTHSWNATVRDEYGGSAASQTFSFEVRHYDPVLDNASASPQGGAQLSQRQTTLEIPLEDRDFAETSGDSVDVEFFVDGNSVGTVTLTNNATASVTTTVSTGGSHDWNATATDEYGRVTNSQDFTFESPDELRVLNESDPDSLVTSGEVELRFYVNETGDPQVFTRNTSSGTVNMTGLPADQPFIVVAEVDGYYSRRIFVPSLYEKQEIFLLPENATAVETIFSIEDYSGQFPEEGTVLEVQRELNGTYRTVLGDFFGATGEFPATLAYNIRHRLVLVNIDTGERRALGTYTPQTTTTQTVTVSPSGQIDVEDTPPTIDLPGTRRLPASDSVPFAVEIFNGSKDINSWTVTIENATATLYSASGTGEATLSPSVNLTGNAGETINATVTYTLEDGSTGSESQTYIVASTFQNDDSLLSQLDALTALVPAQNVGSFQVFLAMLITVFGTAGVASAVRMSAPYVALTAWLFIAGFGILGWVGYDMVFVAGVGAASLAYLQEVR